MEGSSGPPAKLQKRKSRERNDVTPVQMSGALNAPSANSSLPLRPNNMSASEKERRTKWRLSNPFHSKEKDKDKSNGRKEASEPTGDSAYGSSEPSSSANPSFGSNPRPVSREQRLPSPAPTQAPTTSVTAPTPPAHGSYAPPPQPVYSSQENVSRETYQDNRTGNIVTTVTTTTTTTTTTTGPGGSTVVQQPAGIDPSRGSITSTNGPSPPTPVPPVLASYHQGTGHQQSLEHQPHISIPGVSAPPIPTQQQQVQGLAPHVSTLESSSPPLPTKSNIRNRVELDSVSPGIERPNPIVDPVSPVTPSSPTRANFSYPARTSSQSVPASAPAGQGSLQAQDYQQKPSTLANLKLAAAGIHGAGEALRGTFNDTFDRRYAGPDSAAHAKNQATIQAGRAEIEAAQFPHRTRPSLDTTQSPLQPQPLNVKTQYQGPPVSGSQIEAKSTKLTNFMRKIKDGPSA